MNRQKTPNCIPGVYESRPTIEIDTMALAKAMIAKSEPKIDPNGFFARYPHLVDKLKTIKAGGVPLLAPDGNFNPRLYCGGKDWQPEVSTKTRELPAFHFTDDDRTREGWADRLVAVLKLVP